MGIFLGLFKALTQPFYPCPAMLTCLYFSIIDLGTLFCSYLFSFFSFIEPLIAKSKDYYELVGESSNYLFFIQSNLSRKWEVILVLVSTLLHLDDGLPTVHPGNLRFKSQSSNV